MQVWLSYASFEATPASMLGEEEQEEADSEADRRQAAAAQEGPAAAADREAHARRSACLPAPKTSHPPLLSSHLASCITSGSTFQTVKDYSYNTATCTPPPPLIPRPSPPLCVKVSFGPCTVLSLPHGPVCRHLQSLSASASVSCLVCKQRRGSDTLSCKCG